MLSHCLYVFYAQLVRYLSSSLLTGNLAVMCVRGRTFTDTVVRDMGIEKDDIPVAMAYRVCELPTTPGLLKSEI